MIVILALAIAAFPGVVSKLSMLVADVAATALAAFYYWRRERLCRVILAGADCRAHRRAAAKHLQLSIDMVALNSRLPRSTGRDYRLAQPLAGVK